MWFSFKSAIRNPNRRPLDRFTDCSKNLHSPTVLARAKSNVRNEEASSPGAARLLLDRDRGYLARGSSVTWCIILVKIGLTSSELLHRYRLSSGWVKKFEGDDESEPSVSFINHLDHVIAIISRNQMLLKAKSFNFSHLSYIVEISNKNNV